MLKKSKDVRLFNWLIATVAMLSIFHAYLMFGSYRENGALPPIDWITATFNICGFLFLIECRKNMLRFMEFGDFNIQSHEMWHNEFQQRINAQREVCELKGKVFDLEQELATWKE